ncbi:hypothetical protein GCM10020000_57300 [Streptomyces olivoverticillatus]
MPSAKAAGAAAALRTAAVARAAAPRRVWTAKEGAMGWCLSVFSGVLGRALAGSGVLGVLGGAVFPAGRA